MIPPYLLQEMAQLTGEHVVLVLVSMAIAVAAGFPLGVLLTRRAALRTPSVSYTHLDVYKRQSQATAPTLQ